MTVDQPPVIVEEIFDSSAEIVWNAITRHDLMIQWYFDNIPDFKAEVGFETQFNVVSGERNFFHIWKVNHVEPFKKISYNWTYSDYKGSVDVVFELFEENHHIRLKLSCIVLESFPQDIPEFNRESCIGGWNYFIKQNLKEFLD